MSYEIRITKKTLKESAVLLKKIIERRQQDTARQQLRDTIKQSKFNHEQLAERLNINPSTFSEKINEKSPFWEHELIRLADALGISIDQVLFGQPFNRHHQYKALLDTLDQYDLDTVKLFYGVLETIAPVPKQPKFKTGRDRLRHRLQVIHYSDQDISQELGLHLDVFRRKLKGEKFNEHHLKKLSDITSLTVDQILFVKKANIQDQYDDLIRLLEQYPSYTASALNELIKDFQAPTKAPNK